MSRLIEADALMKCIPPEETASRFAVANAPTVDAVPVVHGRWIDTKDGGVCSMCKSGLKIYKKIRPLISFCPFCGARMDGEG